MARFRTLNPTAPMDEDVATMSLAARYVWAYLPCHADKEGRLKDSPFFLKTAIMPGDAIDMEAILAELASRGFIARYEVDGRRFLQIRSFLKHQHPHTREAASSIPAQPTKSVSGPDLGSASALPLPASVSRSPGDPDLDLDPGLDPGLDPEARTPPARAILGPPPPEQTNVTHAPPWARAPRRVTPVALATLPFLDVYNAYPNKTGKLAAAAVFAELAESYVGGEEALTAAILGTFAAGLLKRHPYTGEARWRPSLETFLAERRWEEPASAPDDAETAPGARRPPKELPYA